jgi:hypothetical protein
MESVQALAALMKERPTCSCGCNTLAHCLIVGFGYEPYLPNRWGVPRYVSIETFYVHPACQQLANYMRCCAEELGYPFTVISLELGGVVG